LSRIVLDTSALLALLRDERGASVVEADIENALISAVNFGEAAARQYKTEVTRAEFEAVVAPFNLEIVAVDAELALDTADIREIDRKAGLSQADCICLALAKQKGLPALTADQDWAKVADVLGVEVRMIR
jgi:ribonuclease VapC